MGISSYVLLVRFVGFFAFSVGCFGVCLWAFLGGLFLFPSLFFFLLMTDALGSSCDLELYTWASKTAQSCQAAYAFWESSFWEECLNEDRSMMCIPSQVLHDLFIGKRGI